MPDIVVRSRIRDFAEADGKKLEVASDVFPALCEIVKQKIRKGAERAKANNRNTIMAKDL